METSVIKVTEVWKVEQTKSSLEVASRLKTNVGWELKLRSKNQKAFVPVNLDSHNRAAFIGHLKYINLKVTGAHLYAKKYSVSNNQCPISCQIWSCTDRANYIVQFWILIYQLNETLRPIPYLWQLSNYHIEWKDAKMLTTVDDWWLTNWILGLEYHLAYLVKVDGGGKVLYQHLNKSDHHSGKHKIQDREYCLSGCCLSYSSHAANRCL